MDKYFEHLTSEGSVAQNFEMSSSLTSSLQNVDIDSRNKLWGALVASQMFRFTSSNIFLHGRAQKIQKKCIYFVFHTYFTFKKYTFRKYTFGKYTFGKHAFGKQTFGRRKNLRKIHKKHRKSAKLP